MLMMLMTPGTAPPRAKPRAKPLPARWPGRLAIGSLSLLLAACASRSPAPTPGPAGAPTPFKHAKDGPEASVPADLEQVPDAAPRLEAIRKGGPNKPYEVLGQRYEPQTEDVPLVERGLASWYGRKFHGRPTASGEIYNMYAMTGAHATMPIPSYARVRNPANGREVLLRINDRGPFHRGRIIDLSYTAALKLGVLKGVSTVEVERITYEDIRSGAWQRERDGAAAMALAAATPTTSSAATPAADPPVFVAAAAAGAVPLESTVQLARPEPQAAPRPAVAAEAALPAAPAAASRGFWVQLGAFAKLDGAEAFRRDILLQADWLAPLLALFRDSKLHRLQAGPYASREDAQRAAERVREALALSAVVVQRR